MVIPSCIIEVFFSFLLLNKATNNTISERIIKWLPLTGEPNHFPTKHHLSTPPPRPAFGRRVAQTHSATSHRSLTRPHVRISYRWNISLCNLPSHNTTSKWSFLTYNIKNVERAKRVLGANVSAAGHRCSLSTVLQNKRENKKKSNRMTIFYLYYVSASTLSGSLHLLVWRWRPHRRSFPGDILRADSPVGSVTHESPGHCSSCK